MSTFVGRAQRLLPLGGLHRIYAGGVSYLRSTVHFPRRRPSSVHLRAPQEPPPWLPRGRGAASSLPLTGASTPSVTSYHVPGPRKTWAARLRRVRRRDVAAAFAVVALVATFEWAGLLPDISGPFRGGGGGGGEREKKRVNETQSFVLPLYSKSVVPALQEGTGRRVGGGLPRRRVLQLARNASTAIPVEGNIYPDGQYYTSIFVGNPPRPYFLDVDTGSHLTWIQCDAPCTSCAKGPNLLYKPIKGKIVPPRDSLCEAVQDNENYCATCKQCDYKIDYAERSSSLGVLARDDMHLMNTNGDKPKINFVFGCGYDQRGQLLISPAKTDGILGLGNSRISLPSQLATQGIISYIFGHCISTNATGGGFLFFGDEFVPRWGVTWVPTRNDPSNLYYTEIQKVTYGDQQLRSWKQANKLTQLIFDSGSSYTYFPNEIYIDLISSLDTISPHLVQDRSDNTLPLCWKYHFPVSSLNEVKHLFKPLTLHFSKRWLVMPTILTIPPDGYVVLTDKGNVCLGILNGTAFLPSFDSKVILGDVSLRGKLVIYNNEAMKIGWAQSNCTVPRQKSSPFFL